MMVLSHAAKYTYTYNMSHWQRGQRRDSSGTHMQVSSTPDAQHGTIAVLLAAAFWIVVLYYYVMLSARLHAVPKLDG